MGTNEPFHDPADLLDELDAIIREQESLRHRAIALAAKYRSLETHADRFNKPGKYEGLPEEYGEINVDHTAIRLGDAAKDMACTVRFVLYPARDLAVKVREYPQSEREQAGASHAGDTESDTGAPSSALADYRPGTALADRGEADRGGR
ncbi:hypothetical protein [Nocardia wallacei]|uniref:hypothetical protein n=1 Tax=Nocardia wallacei TaxID=480035 RepID=UPI002458C2AF|nr:hypothetical protein [Nocardia wallacei]